VNCLAFYGLDQNLLYWAMPFDTLEWAIRHGAELRNDPPYASLTLPDGSSSKVIDYTQFTDAGMFEGVIPSLYYDIGDPDAFVYQAWSIVTQLSHWAEEEGEIPRTPLETLVAGGGDCEDLSILLASLLKAAPLNWQVGLALIDAYHPEAAVNFNHVIVYIDYDGRRRLIETTNPNVMEPYTNGVDGRFREVIDP
jgi:hypothetical protein